MATAISGEAILIRRDETSWRNWHRTVRQAIDARWEVHNHDPQAPSLASVRRTTASLQQIMRRARNEGRRLRATGAKWSFSEVATTDGWVVDTQYLNWWFRVSEASIDPSYAGDRGGLLLVQTGISISELNQHLEAAGRSLRTSGASNGQTITGAMATGTHGSAIDVGGIQSQVVGLQLLAGPDRVLWLERRSRPVAAAALVERLGAELVRDDELFEAVLVGLGAFGIIHMVMIETVPQFLLSANQERMLLGDGLRRAMDRLDFTGVTLPEERRPYFFQVIVNPHASDNVAYVKTMFQHPRGNHVPDYSIDGKYGAGYDMPGLIGRLLDAAPMLTRELTNAIVGQQLKQFHDRRGTWGETFDYTTPRSESAGAALAVPASETTRALAVLRAAFDSAGPAPVAFACRYVAKSPGLLAFTHFAPTCVIDIDGLHSERTLRVMEAARAGLETAGIPFAQHWGKLHGLTAARVRASYGANVDRWRGARATLLPAAADRRMFSNAMLDGLGLTN